MTLNLNAITVKIKFLEEKNFKATIVLDFGNFVIKGFRVRTSEYDNIVGEKLWLTPPAYRDSGGRYHPIFFMPDKEEWHKLELKIWEEYSKQRDMHYKKRFGG